MCWMSPCYWWGWGESGQSWDSPDWYENQISCGALSFNIWEPQNLPIFSFWCNTFVSISTVGKERKRVCIRLKIFLDGDLDATAGRFGDHENNEPTLVRKELQPFLPCFSVSITPSSSAQNSCFRLLSVSPVSHFVSRFHALAHDAFASWGASPHLFRKCLSVLSEAAPESVRPFLEEQELAPALCLTYNEPLQIVYLLFLPP